MTTEPAKPRSLYEELFGAEEHEKQVKQEKVDLANLKESFKKEDKK